MKHLSARPTAPLRLFSGTGTGTGTFTGERVAAWRRAVLTASPRADEPLEHREVPAVRMTLAVARDFGGSAREISGAVPGFHSACDGILGQVAARRQRFRSGKR